MHSGPLGPGTDLLAGVLFGMGLWAGRADCRVMLAIVGGWLATLPVAGLLVWAFVHPG